MKIKPVEYIPAPDYPDKYTAEAKKALASALPHRWRKVPIAVALSAAVSLGFSGCDVQTPSTYSTVENETGIHTPGEQNIAEVPPMPISHRTFIPLFEYGEGTGSIGCVVISAPVFMSEEEAFAILSAAFADAGLTLNMAEYPLGGKTLPVTNLSPRLDDHAGPRRTTQGELTVAMLDIDGQLPVTFVSRNDVDNWRGEDSFSSASTFLIQDAAHVLVESNPRLVVFYDPVARSNSFWWDWWGVELEPGESEEEFRERGVEEWRLQIYAEAERLQLEGPMERQPGESDRDYSVRLSQAERQNTLAISEALLREQVAAFVEWLRTEGHH